MEDLLSLNKNSHLELNSGNLIVDTASSKLGGEPTRHNIIDMVSNNNSNKMPKSKEVIKIEENNANTSYNNNQSQ